MEGINSKWSKSQYLHSLTKNTNKDNSEHDNEICRATFTSPWVVAAVHTGKITEHFTYLSVLCWVGDTKQATKFLHFRLLLQSK